MAKNFFYRNWILFLGIVAIISAILYSQGQPATTFASQVDPFKIIELTNLAREADDLPALQFEDKLAQAARRKAQDIFDHQYFAHKSKKGLGLADWLKQVNYSFMTAGENLSHDFYSEEGVVNNWMRSPSHRQNILDQQFTEIGVATLGGRLFGSDTVIVVQVFGQAATD